MLSMRYHSFILDDAQKNDNNQGGLTNLIILAEGPRFLVIQNCACTGN